MKQGTGPDQKGEHTGGNQKQSSPVAIQQAVQARGGLNSAFQAADLKGQGALANAVGEQKMLLLADLQQQHKALCGSAAKGLTSAAFLAKFKACLDQLVATRRPWSC